MGFLDPQAPDAASEYTRYLDGDLLGKLVTKRLLMHVLGYDATEIVIPVGRYGDAKTRYDENRRLMLDLGDGYIEESTGLRTNIEIKCAKITLVNRFHPNEAENWAFTGLIHSPGKVQKKYDVLIAVGLWLLSLESDLYWKRYAQQRDLLFQQGHAVQSGVLPHEAEFLPMCSFFFIPRVELKHNFFRVGLSTLSKTDFAKYHARGYDIERCQQLWKHAVRRAHGA